MAERRRSSSSPVRQDDAYFASRCSELVLQLRRDFAARDLLYHRTDQVLWSTYPVRIPEAYTSTTQEIRSPLALNIAQTIAASLSVNPAQVHFEPLSGTQPGQLNAEHRQAFFEASWKRQEQEAGRQLLRLFIWSLVSKGEGILKTIERSKAAWRGYTAFSKELLKRLDDASDEEYGELARGGDEAKKQGAYDRATERFKEGAPYPISSTDVPPDTFYYWRTLDGLRVAAELVEVPYLEALDRYGAGLDTDGNVTRYEALGLPRSEWESVMSGGTTLTLEEVWEWDVCHYVLSGPGQRIDGTGAGTARRPGTLVKNPIKHGYGDRYLKVLRGPYFHALGSTTASRLPERAGLSILFPFLSLFPALDSYLTMQSNAAYRTGYAAFKRSQPSGMALASTLGGAPNAPFGLEGVEPDALASQLQTIEPGTIYPYDVQPIDQPKTGQDLRDSIATIRGFIELALPSVVQGVMADSSGYAINQAAHLARLAWDPIVGNAETALSQRTGFESWLIQHKVGETVYAWSGGPGSGGRLRRSLATAQKGPSGWLGVGPDDLRGAHRYTDTLDPDVPSNKALDVQMHESMVRNNFESVEQAIEALGGDPGETERQIIVANVKKSPPVQDRLMKRIEQQLGFIDEKTLAQVGAGPDGAPQLPPELAAMMGAGAPGGPPGNGTIPGSAPGQAPPGPGGPGGPGGGLGPLGPQVFAPGVNMPTAPTPGGSVTGGGPPARAGNAPGSPWQPSSPPAGALPLPGQ